ncbi:uncharacterized protein TNCV_3952921, partial [Trichonephila clavipes]
ERLGLRHVKTVVYGPQANRTERVNCDLVQIIANYVNEQHDTWDQFLREFAYAIRTAVNETTGKPPAELFLVRKLITPFQKLVMVSDGTEFAVGDIERVFEEARRNTKAKHEKWEKYYNRDAGVMCNLRVLDVKNNNVVVWKVGKRLTVNVDQVRIYLHRKCDETEIGTGSSDNCSLRDESSGFDRVQRRSNESQRGRHNREDQFDPEKAEEETTTPISQSEQDQVKGMPDEEVTINGSSGLGKERGVYENVYILGGPGRKRQLQVIRTSSENRRVRFQCCRDHGDRGMDQLVTVLFTDEYFQRTEESVSNVAEIMEIKAWINR